MADEPIILDTGINSLLCPALEEPAPYYAKAYKVENGPNCWSTCRIDVIERSTETVIGNYNRNYSPLRTFHPFKLRGKWYALYSKDYTCTRIMELPSCKDIGGEDPECNGFCPVDFFVPGLHYIESKHFEYCPRHKTNKDYTKSCICNFQHKQGCVLAGDHANWDKRDDCICKEEAQAFHDWQIVWHFPERVHGFVAGCMWGDDSSMKIEYLDLSHADEGIIKREARFGYISLPGALHLNQAIELEVDEDLDPWLKIATESYYKLKTGERNDI
jgi:hypothetical protein